MPRQGAAVDTARAPTRRLQRRVALLRRGLGRSHGLLQVLETELQLLRVDQLLGAAAELGPLQLPEQCPESLDLGIPGRQGGRELAHHLLQERRVRRQLGQVDLHDGK